MHSQQFHAAALLYAPYNAASIPPRFTLLVHGYKSSDCSSGTAQRFDLGRVSFILGLGWCTGSLGCGRTTDAGRSRLISGFHADGVGSTSAFTQTDVCSLNVFLLLREETSITCQVPGAFNKVVHQKPEITRGLHCLRLSPFSEMRGGGSALMGASANNKVEKQ